MDIKEKIDGIFDKDGDGKADIVEKVEEKVGGLKLDKDGDGKIDILENIGDKAGDLGDKIGDKAGDLGDKIGGIFKKD